MNQLKDELSQYLSQHASNPVHWLPYGSDAFDKAKELNRPVFISIGYSSCHWCHVMSHESFENQEIANMLNEKFICIKVDKEEYPEVDSYYQKACTLFTGGGGWPLNGFLTPDGDPIFVGTYLPAKTTHKNAPTFPQLINEISGAFEKDQSGVVDSAKEMTENLTSSTEVPEVKFEGHFPHPSIVANAIKQFADEKNGGFGEAPKFPQFSFYEWAVEHIAQGNIPMELGTHFVTSLEKILCGGIYDHARGGIHRYSVDEKWMVPHFEKMLYDQAGLLRVLAKFSLIHPSPLVYDAVFNTLTYLEKEMLGTDNFFLSGQDADSEGQEGLYFTFTKDEFEDIINQEELNLTEEDIQSVRRWFPIEEKGNFENGLNVVSMNHGELKNTFTDKNWNIIRSVRRELLSNRSQRIPPQTDQKGIASWNFQLLSSLCDVIQYVNIPEIKHYASTILRKTLEPVLSTFTSVSDKKTLLSHTTSQKNKTDLFEDYVSFADLMIRSYEVSGNEVFKQNLKNVLEMIRNEFFNENDFYCQKINCSSLIPNLKTDLFDQSYRSSMAVLIKVARRAKVMFGDESIMPELTEDFLKNAAFKALQNPIYHGEALNALSYPDQFYQKILVPRSWLKEERYIKLMQSLMTKVVLDYHDENSWQLCDLKSCQSSGTTIEELLTVVAPKPETKTKDKE